MNLLYAINDEENFDAALHFLQRHNGVRIGKAQKEFIELVKKVPLDKRLLVKQNYEDLFEFLRRNDKLPFLLYNELENLITVDYPARMGKMYAIALVFVLVAVSQNNRDCALIVLTGTQSKEFIELVSKMLNLFKKSEEFAWELDMKDARKVMRINNKKHHSHNRIKVYVKSDTPLHIKQNSFIVDIVQ